MVLTNCPSQKQPALAAVITTLILSLAAAGCGSSPVAPAPVPDSLSSLVDVSPTLGTKLLHGQTLTFTATAGYSLNSANSGAVVLAIEDQTSKPLTTTQPMARVTKGSEQVTLSQSVTLPDTGVSSVRVYFLLVPDGATSTKAVAPLTYQVQ